MRVLHKVVSVLCKDGSVSCLMFPLSRPLVFSAVFSSLLSSSLN